MNFIHDNVRDIFKIISTAHASQYDSGRTEEQLGLFGRLGFAANGIAYRAVIASLGGDARGDGYGRDTAWLGNEDIGGPAGVGGYESV